MSAAPANVTVSVDASVFRQNMSRYVRELGLQAKDVIKDQTRLLLKQIIGLTPPKTLAQGRRAVERDIRRAMTPLGLEFFPEKRMHDRVELLVEKQDARSLQAIFANSDSWHGWRVEQFAEPLHTFARDRRGRVPKGRKIWVTEATTKPRQWNRYLKQMRGYVGRLKAGWGPAYEAVGGNLPAWVKRHSNPHGEVRVKLDERNPSIELRNYAVGVGQMHRAVAFAMKVRGKAMASDLRRRLAGIARRSGLK